MKGVAGVAAIVVLMIGIAVLAIRITAAASATPLPLAYGFDGGTGWKHGEVRPADIYFGAGGSLMVRDLRWTSWTSTLATGQGIRWADSCVPDCAAGSYVRSPVTVTLSAIRIHAGARYFSQLIIGWSAGGKEHEITFSWSPGAVRGAPPFWAQLPGQPGSTS